MELILLEKVLTLGDLGDKVKVKPGYGRNYLMPLGKAVPATKKNIEEFEKRRAELEKMASDKLVSATGRSKLLEGVEVTIAAHASEEGKLYGSVSPADIVESLAKLGHEVEKKDVNMPEAIRHVGEYNVSVALHTDIVVDIKVIVEPSEEEKQ